MAFSVLEDYLACDFFENQAMLRLIALHLLLVYFRKDPFLEFDVHLSIYNVHFCE